MMKPRRLPRIGVSPNPENQNINPNISPPSNIQTRNKRRNPEEDLINNNTDPDFIKKYRRIRNRHQEDFAINLVPNKEDIIAEDVRLYENKNINLETPKIKENIGLESTEFYIESIHHDQYYKINQIKKEEKKKEEILGEAKPDMKKRRKSVHKKFTALEQAQALENKLYQKFDKELTDVITKTLSKVTIIFLFTQGLLAGMGLLHIIFFFSYDNYDSFLYFLSRMIIILFDIFHALTFTSLVGNGIKFISSYQKYNIMNLQIHANNNEFMRLRRDMIFSGILLILFTVVFGFEIYLATFIQKINLNKCYTVGDIKENRNIYVDEDEFTMFKVCHIVLDIVVIILFILNIFDLNVQEDRSEHANRPINVNFYLGSENQNDGNGNDVLTHN